MRFFLLLLILLAWGLWIGGTIATFVFGLNLFHTHAPIAGEANSAMFLVFGKYEMVLAGISIMAAGILLAAHPTRSVALLILCLILAGAMSMTSGIGFAPRMESLREQGETHGDEFHRLHKKSMIAMTGQSAVLLLSGAVLLLAVQRKEMQATK